MRIVDFIEQYRQYNLSRRFPKGTKVMFNLPKDDRFRVEHQTVKTGIGFIYSHDDSGYSIYFDGRFIDVPYDDVLASMAELDKFPICDSLLNSMSFTKKDNFNELAKKLMYTFQNADSDTTIDLCTDVQSMVASLKDNEELQVFVFDTEFLEQNIETDAVNVEDLELLGKFGEFYVYCVVYAYEEE